MKARCTITNQEFTISPAEEEYCRTNGLPLPTQAPIQRLRHLTLFRNRINLYHTTCGLTKKPIFTAISPEKRHTVFDIDAWESDDWDPLQYGVDYNLSKSFFEQLYSLFIRVPLPNRAVIPSTMENSDYTNGISGSKNCYLHFAASYCEDCMFTRMVNYCRNVLDCVMAIRCELCYACTDIVQCYNLKFSDHCNTCSDSYFLYNCQSCTNCYGCTNLNNKQYYFFNEKCTKDDYFKRLEEIDLGSFKTVEREQKRFLEFRKSFPQKYYFGKNNQNSTGSFLNNTKNCHSSYFVAEAEDLEHCIWVDGGKTSFFYCMYGNGAELIYNSVSCGDNAYNLKFCSESWMGVHDLEYCLHCRHGSGDCFGCVSLKKHNYCILNKQYSKKDYFELLSRIKNQMRESKEYGQFFPTYFSPHAYNRSEASDFFPLSQQEALALDFPWKDDDDALLPGEEPIPDHIRDVGDDFLAKQLSCAETGKKYRIASEELAFYRKTNLPLPRVAPLERIKLRSGILAVSPLQAISCGKCGEGVLSSYNPSQAVLYCEKCFQDALL